MSEYSHPLGDTVKRPEKKMGLTQNQVAVLTNSNERTIMNIEMQNYTANTTMEVLYPLIRTLRFTKGKVERLVRFEKENFLVRRVFWNITKASNLLADCTS